MLLYLAACLCAEPGLCAVSASHLSTFSVWLLMTSWLMSRLRLHLLTQRYGAPILRACPALFSHLVPAKDRPSPSTTSALVPLCVHHSLSSLSGMSDRRCKRSPLSSSNSTRYVTVPLSPMSEIERGASPLESLCLQLTSLTLAVCTLQKSYQQLEDRIQLMGPTLATPAPATAPGFFSSEWTFFLPLETMPPPEPRVPVPE